MTRGEAIAVRALALLAQVRAVPTGIAEQVREVLEDGAGWLRSVSLQPDEPPVVNLNLAQAASVDPGCPACGGEGVVRVRSRYLGHKPEEKTCEACGGSGRRTGGGAANLNRIMGDAE